MQLKTKWLKNKTIKLIDQFIFLLLLLKVVYIWFVYILGTIH